MSEWRPRRFWKQAIPTALAEGGFAIHLDGRPVRTPAKTLLALPNESLARWVAREWNAQDEVIDPTTMPATRTANAAVDKVTPHFSAVAADIAGYGESDLICYRAATPAELAARQADAWDTLIDWARHSLGAPLAVGTGVMHVAQAEASVEALAREVRRMTPWQLAAFHDLVALSGSLVIGLAVLREFAPVEELWQCSRIDERWQEELWGQDDEAEAAAEARRQAFHHAADFSALVKT